MHKLLIHVRAYWFEGLAGEGMMKNRILVMLMLIVLLTSMLSLPLITSLSAAEDSRDSVHYQESVKGASGVAPPKEAPKQNATNNLYSDWQNIFGNDSSSGSTQKWDFNNTNAWLSSAYSDGNKTRLIVGLSNNTFASLPDVAQIAARHQGKIVDTVSFKGVVRAAVVELPLTSVTSFVGEVDDAKLASYVEPNMKMQTQLVPNDPSWNLQWGPQKVQADWAWNTTTGNSSVLVAVVDTGIDYSHPELTANFVPLGFDWANNDTDPSDDCGHGTHCAGIIAAAINNGIGIAGLAQVRIMAEKVLDYSGWGYDDWVANGIIHAVDQGAKVISMSLGGSGDSELIHDAVRYAYSAGVLVIAAAGNDNTNMKMYPAAYDEVIAVAATDQNDFKAYFSNWGDWIELAAPGVEIYSTMPTYHVTMNDEGYASNYDYMSGTSMACPHVAGVAALLWSHYPTKSRDWIRQWLRYTADDLGDSGFDVYYGYGRINARNAVEQSLPTHELIMSSWVTPPYVEPGTTGLVNASVLNFGESDETNVTVELLANDSVVNYAMIDFITSGGLATASLAWNPTAEGSYNITAYVVPVAGETSTENNALSKNIFVGTPVTAVVLHSSGNVESNAIISWQTLNAQWQLFGNTMVYVDYATLNKENITYADIAATGADVLIISCAYDSYAGWEFTDSEINAVTRYVHEGHGLIATAGTFYIGAPNNNKLMPLFGMNQYISYYETGTDLLHLLNSTHPLFTDVPNPLVFPNVGSAVPTSGLWDSNELTEGKYLAMGHFNESAIVAYKGLLYISPWFEMIPPYYQHPLKLLYNAILWSRYQKPQHELEVSLEAPSYLRPGDSALLNATVFNMGLNDETNVRLDMLLDNSTVSSIVIPELPVASSFTIQFLWSPTIEKVYNVTAYAPPVPGEDSTSNNMVSFFVNVRYLELALFENVDPWDYPANEEALSLYGIAYAVFSSSDFGLVNLSSFSKVVIASDQDQAFYNAMDAYRWWFEDYVSSGGVLEIHAADSGWNGGEWVGTLPSGLGWTHYSSDCVTIVDPAHPAVTTPNLITDAELDWWGSSVHGYFSSYPADSEVVITEDFRGYPAYLKFDYGLGSIVASSQTLEWAYEHKYSRILENSLLYSPIRYPYDVAVNLETPTFVTPVESTLLNATVINRGLNNETNVELQLIINSTLVTSDLLQSLPSGSSYMLSYLWNHTTEGTYNITAYAPRVENETMLTNNVATRFVTVAEALIHPVEGQYANYTICAEDLVSGSRTFQEGWNFTYAKYISPYQMNVTMLQYQQNPDYSTTGWMVVDTFNRLVEEDSGIGWTGMWYPGWIETNINVGSTINLLNYNPTVTGSRPILVGNRLIDCWEIPINLTGLGGYDYMFWYDKASGLWIAMDASYGSQTLHLILADTNVPIGTSYEHELAATLDAPSLVEPGENTTLNATVYNVGLNDETNVRLQIIINDTTVDDATINTLHVNENYTLRFLWTPLQASRYNVTAYASPVAGEQWTENNAVTRIVACFYSHYTRRYASPQWVGGGTAMNWHADDGCWQYTLPFDFLFYGVSYRTIYISSNGLITFYGPDTSPGNSIPELARRPAIAPAWDDWVTDGGHDIYIWTNSTHLGIMWYVRSYGGNIANCNFEALLSSEGIIQFDYGSCDGTATVTLGISNGFGQIIAEDQTNLSNAQTIIFTPSASRGIPGDVDGDGRVTLADLTCLAIAFNSIPGNLNWNPNADLAEPWGIIGLTDLVTIAMYYGSGNP
jgi:thermitase